MWFLHYCDSVSTGICNLERDECCFKDVNTKHCSTVQTVHPSCTESQSTYKATFTQEPCMMMEPSPSLVQRKTCFLLPRSSPQTTDSTITQNTDMESMICLLSINLLEKPKHKSKQQQPNKTQQTNKIQQTNKQKTY